MADKVVLHYFNGRGKMESIRWLLTAANVEVSEGCGDIYQNFVVFGHQTT